MTRLVLVLAVLAATRCLFPAEEITSVLTLPGGSAATSATAWKPVTAPTGQRDGLLWKVSSGRNSIFLLGSIHSVTRDFYPVPQHIEAAFQASNVLVLEVDLNHVNWKALATRMGAAAIYAPSDSLWKHISRETKQELTHFSDDRGIDPELFAQLKPWAAALAVESLESPDRAGMVAGLDRYFLGRTNPPNTVRQVETAESQLKLFTVIPAAEQDQYLAAALRSAGDDAGKIRHMQDLWMNGDADGLADLISYELREIPEYEKRVFTDRNPRMADAAEQCLTSGERCFVVVGAGHVVGPAGIVSELESRGYQVEQVLSAK